MELCHNLVVEYASSQKIYIADSHNRAHACRIRIYRGLYSTEIVGAYERKQVGRENPEVFVLVMT